MKSYPLQILTDGDRCHQACPYLPSDIWDNNGNCKLYGGSLAALEARYNREGDEIICERVHLVPGRPVRVARCLDFTGYQDAQQKTPSEEGGVG